jgi:hypothetical protein
MKFLFSSLLLSLIRGSLFLSLIRGSLFLSLIRGSLFLSLIRGSLFLSLSLGLNLFYSEISKAESPELKITLGRWRQSCLHRNMNEEFFAASEVRYSETYFSDDQCQQPLISFISQGPYQTRQNKIDFAFSTSEVVIFSAQISQGFNQRAVCGWSNWTTGSRSILDQMCDFFNLGRNFPTPKRAQQKFGIYKIENSLLFFGQLTSDTDGSSDARRPIQFNPRSYQYVN